MLPTVLQLPKSGRGHITRENGEEEIPKVFLVDIWLNFYVFYYSDGEIKFMYRI